MRACMDVKGKNEKIIGGVCIIPAKDFGKNDITFMPSDKETRSFRSTTELINTLTKLHASYEERKKVMDFIGERLRALESEEISGGGTVGPISLNGSQKRKVKSDND